MSLSAEGGKCYVCVTIPYTLTKGSQKQMMCLNGTIGLGVAKTKLVPLANAIYAGFDQKLAGLDIPYVDETTENNERSLNGIERSMKDNMVEKQVNDKIVGHSACDTAGKYGFGPLSIPRAIAKERFNIGFCK